MDVRGGNSYPPMKYDPDGIFTCTHKMCSVNGGVSSHPLAFALMF